MAELEIHSLLPLTLRPSAADSNVPATSKQRGSEARSAGTTIAVGANPRYPVTHDVESGGTAQR